MSAAPRPHLVPRSVLLLFFPTMVAGEPRHMTAGFPLEVPAVDNTVAPTSTTKSARLPATLIILV